MKRLKMFISFILLSFGMLFAQDNILVFPENPIDNNNETDRSVIVVPIVFQTGQSVTIDYPMPTVSQVIIRDADTGAVVYSAPYNATRQVLINLSSLSEGTYEIHLYAYGKWWWGEFELDNN